MNTYEKNIITLLLVLMGLFLLIEALSYPEIKSSESFSCERTKTEITCTWAECTNGIIIISSDNEKQVKELETHQGTYTFLGLKEEKYYATLVCDEGISVRKII